MPPDARYEGAEDLFVILDLLRGRHGMTRPALGDETGYGRKLVTQRVQQLIDAGLVVEGEKVRSTGGRPALEVAFDPSAGHVLVAELGTNDVIVGVADLSGRVLATHEEPAEFARGPEVQVTRVSEIWDELMQRVRPDRPPVRAIGVGVRGPVDPSTGRTTAVVLSAGWADYPIRDRLLERFGAPAWVDNDINMIAVGEFRRRPPGSVRELALVRIDLGIGAGIIAGGRLQTGIRGVAGEIGHLVVTNDPTTVCWCGNVGCLVEISSEVGLMKRAVGAARSGEFDRAPRTLTELIELANSEHPAAIRLLREAGDGLGLGLAAIANVINPQEIVLGGSVMAAGGLVMGTLWDRLERSTFPPARVGLTISVAHDGSRNSLIGAAATAIDGLFSPPFSDYWL